MAAPSLAPALDSASRRRFFRHAINVPLDVIALRSGIPNNLPGRCTDLSEAGIGAIVAGELVPGQPVAIELRLPNVGLPVRARAQVRYEDRLHCGLQFVGLSAEQREMIRYWASTVAAEVPRTGKKADSPQPHFPALAVVAETEKGARGIRVGRRRLYFLLAFMLGLAALGWWQWQRAWNELEETSLAADALRGTSLRVAPETMDERIVYKVDPVYPEAARLAGTEGLVVLDAVIAADGSVRSLRPLAGPELLAQAALDAVRSWKYIPYRNDGQPVEVETIVSVDFRLH